MLLLGGVYCNGLPTLLLFPKTGILLGLTCVTEPGALEVMSLTIVESLVYS